DQDDEVRAGEFFCEFWRDGAVDLGRPALFVTDALAVEEHPRGHLGRHEGGRGESPAYAHTLDEGCHERPEELAIVLVKGAESSEELGPVGRWSDAVRDRP